MKETLLLQAWKTLLRLLFLHLFHTRPNKSFGFSGAVPAQSTWEPPKR